MKRDKREKAVRKAGRKEKIRYRCELCPRTYTVKEHFERHERQCKEYYEAKKRREQ